MAIYLDNSATTRVRDEVAEAMRPFLTDKWGNPSSIHKLGRESRGAVEVARRQVAKLMGANPDEIYFTPCGTYSNNVALLGRARFVEENNLGRHLITTCIEHSSSLGPAKHLASKGWKVTYVHVDSEGFIDMDELRQAITAETSIMSLMLANNEIGTVQPIEEVAKIARAHNIFFHSDAVQASGKIPIDLSQVPADSMAISGHKYHAPKGIGILYVRKGVEVLPLMFGGGQERGLFPGTENLGNIVAIGKASEIAFNELDANQAKLRRIQKMMIERLTDGTGARLSGAQDLTKRIPGHISLIVEGALGEELVMDADFKGICISSVSACSQAGHDPSHVLSCIGYPKEQVLGSARITAGSFNTEEECAKAAETLREIIIKRVSKRKPMTAAAG